MKSPFRYIRHAHTTFDHFHQNLHHAFVLIICAMIGMLRGASQLLTPSTANRQWGSFITSDFWEQNPSDGNIKYALFGDGSPGSTAYTRLRDSSCVPTSNIVYTNTVTGGSLANNTIYIINSGTHTLSSPLILNDCSALIGRGDITVKMTGSNSLSISGSHRIIIDNIKFDGQSSTATGMYMNNISNTTLNNLDIYNFSGTNNAGIAILNSSTNISLHNSRIVYGYLGILFDNSIGHINNSMFYNLLAGVSSTDNSVVTINNSLYFNNIYGFHSQSGYSYVHNSLFYNNLIGINYQYATGTTNNIHLYNNTHGISLSDSDIIYYGNLNFFNNTFNVDVFGVSTINTGTVPLIATRSAGQFSSGTEILNYDRFTNPQNGIGQRLLSGTNRTSLRGIKPFTIIKPIRYIFGGNILKQQRPVRYNGTTLQEYGTNSADYFTTRYIAEPESSLPLNQQALVNQYFGSGSMYTTNRETNGCSLSAFQVKNLNPGSFGPSSYHLEDHTIYILTGGEYRYTSSVGNAFVFDGNCIALIGSENTRFTKSNGALPSMLYANNKRNIIIENIKIDGTYYGINLPGGTNTIGIKFDGSTNNNTLNKIQVYNNGQYGIYLGLGSHHTTIMNTQLFNNNIAGMYLYYASNYNTINNTQTYNNMSYGIRFANGSSKNTMNNFQSYNNTIGVFGDLTTTENVINNAAIYNNSDAGIYFKNSSGNMINDTRIYNNQRGIKALYNSPGNKYYGKLELYNNLSGNFDGTTADDSILSAGAGLFAYPGTISTGTLMQGCSYATNPSTSGTFSIALLNSSCDNRGYTVNFVSPDNTYISYTFGLQMKKQVNPKRYNVGGGGLVDSIPSHYDPNKYIAEIFAIRDETPENMFFDSTGNSELDTRYTTNVYTAATINTTINAELTLLPSTATGYLIISGQNVGMTGTVNNGNTLQIAVRSSTGYNTTITGMITLGTATGLFVVTTKNYNELPSTGTLNFSSFTSLETDVWTGNSTVVAGLETGVYASITFAPLSSSGWLEIYSGGSMIASGTTGLLVHNGNIIKTRTKSSSSYGQTVTGYITVGLGTGHFTLTTKGGDTTPPTTPSITYPLSGEFMFFITFDRTASTDTGSGIEGYEYMIASDSSFMDIVNTGFIATETGTTGSPNTTFTSKSGRHYFKMRAKDRDGNYSPRSNTGDFRVLSLVNRTLAKKTGVNLISYYTSDILEIKGITSGISLRASSSNNTLIYKNGEERGTGVFVQNNDLLYLKIRSSNNYNKTVTGTLTLANRIADFIVTTKITSMQGCTLTDDDRDIIETIFDSLVQDYLNNPELYEEFLYTMQSMLQDEINFTNNCNLMYLQDLIKQALGLTQIVISTGTHIAPNCKEYAISYDMETYTYTSPTLMHAIYFTNRDTLARYIDSRNAGDCHINTYGPNSRFFNNTDPNKHIAPNGKIYFIIIEGGKYTSNNFMFKKYFNSLTELRNHIDKYNPPSQIWNHQVDTTFTPQTHIAPNAKEYKIYKTNRGYMSYKLLKVQYFGSLAELQSYINRNNSR